MGVPVALGTTSSKNIISSSQIPSILFLATLFPRLTRTIPLHTMTSALRLRRQTIGLLSKGSHISYRAIHTSPVTRASDPRIDDLDLGHKYHDEFAALRDKYGPQQSATT